MRAGRLRHRVDLERPSPTTNDYGEPETGWEFVARSWAAIEPLRGNERMQAMYIQAEANIRIILRWSTDVQDVDPSWRVVGRKTYDIKAVMNIDERNREIHLMCKEHI